MVENIRSDIGDLKAIQRLEFTMIAGVVIAEILRSFIR
jgi:hypothetical protein